MRIVLDVDPASGSVILVSPQNAGNPPPVEPPPVQPPPVEPPPVIQPPPVDPSDPLSAFKARWHVGQLCAWSLCTDAERTALSSMYDPMVVVQYVQWYGAGSGGGININVQPYNGGYRFWSIQADGWIPDVGGSGDAYVQWLCDQQGRAVPGVFPQW